MLFNFLSLLTFSFLLIGQKVELKCIDPNATELNTILNSYIEKYYKQLQYVTHEEMIAPDSEFSHLIRHLTEDNGYPRYNNGSENEQCKKHETASKVPSLCGERLVKAKRSDRYPFEINYVMCCGRTCNNQLLHSIQNNSEIEYRCQTANDLRPILMRGFCPDKKKNEWVFGLESVPIRCKCTVSSKHAHDRY